MQSRALGNTGLSVSSLGFGGASLGGIYGAVGEAEARRTVRRAFDLGITLFDTSPYYGRTVGEAVLGRALAELPREQLVLSTKAGRYGMDEFDFTPARLRSSLDESLVRLGTDYVDILLLHDVEFGDLDRVFADSLPALAELKAAGKVRCIGMSGLPLPIFQRLFEVGAQLDVVLSYCHATLFDTSLIDLIPALNARGVAVMNASPAAMGLLSSHGPPDWHPAPVHLRRACRRAAEFCAAHGVELAEVALAFSSGLSGPVATLCGAASVHELERSVAAASSPPDAEILAAVRSILAPVMGHTWPQGRPENDGRSGPG